MTGALHWDSTGVTCTETGSRYEPPGDLHWDSTGVACTETGSRYETPGAQHSDSTCVRCSGHTCFSSGIKSVRILDNTNLVEIPEPIAFMQLSFTDYCSFSLQGIVFMESVVDVLPSWDIFPEVGRKAFQNMRSEGGEEMVLKKNFFKPIK